MEDRAEELRKEMNNMIRKMLYRIENEDGSVTVTLQKPPKGIPYQVRWRLIAEEGQAITDGRQTVTVIDLIRRKDCRNWSDCEAPEDEHILPKPPAYLFPSEGE